MGSFLYSANRPVSFKEGKPKPTALPGINSELMVVSINCLLRFDVCVLDSLMMSECLCAAFTRSLYHQSSAVCRLFVLPILGSLRCSMFWPLVIPRSTIPGIPGQKSRRRGITTNPIKPPPYFRRIPLPSFADMACCTDPERAKSRLPVGHFRRIPSNVN